MFLSLAREYWGYQEQSQPSSHPCGGAGSRALTPPAWGALSHRSHCTGTNWDAVPERWFQPFRLPGTPSCGSRDPFTRSLLSLWAPQGPQTCLWEPSRMWGEGRGRCDMSGCSKPSRCGCNAHLVPLQVLSAQKVPKRPTLRWVLLGLVGDRRAVGTPDPPER